MSDTKTPEQHEAEIAVLEAEAVIATIVRSLVAAAALAIVLMFISAIVGCSPVPVRTVESRGDAPVAKQGTRPAVIEQMRSEGRAWTAPESGA